MKRTRTISEERVPRGFFGKATRACGCTDNRRPTRSRTRTLVALCLSVLAILLATPRLSYSQECTAPVDERHLLIPTPTCRQLWEYQIYRKLAIEWISIQQAQIDRQERMADNVHRTMKGLVAIASLTQSLVEPDAAVRAVETSFSPLLMNDFLVGEDLGGQIGSGWVSNISDMLIGVTQNAVTGTVSAPYTQVVSLAIDLGTLWNIRNVEVKRNNIVVAQAYLTQFYKLGGTDEVFANYLVIDANTPFSEQFRVYVQNQGYERSRGFRFSSRAVEQQVSAFRNVVSSLADQREHHPRQLPPDIAALAVSNNSQGCADKKRDIQERRSQALSSITKVYHDEVARLGQIKHQEILNSQRILQRELAEADRAFAATERSRADRAAYESRYRQSYEDHRTREKEINTRHERRMLEASVEHTTRRETVNAEYSRTHEDVRSVCERRTRS